MTRIYSTAEVEVIEAATAADATLGAELEQVLGHDIPGPDAAPTRLCQGISRQRPAIIGPHLHWNGGYYAVCHAGVACPTPSCHPLDELTPHDAEEARKEADEASASDPIYLDYTPNNVYIRFGCAICGGSTEKQDFLAEFTDADGDRHIACDECATSGPAGIRDRFLGHAARLEGWAWQARRQAGYRYELRTPVPERYCSYCKGTADLSSVTIDGASEWQCGSCGAG